jgi:flagellar assembly factor FliW
MHGEYLILTQPAGSAGIKPCPGFADGFVEVRGSRGVPMPVLETKYFGVISYQPDAVIDFPGGLPAFESRRRFVAIRFPDRDPLVFLQSLEDSSLCFIALPVLALDRDYRLRLAEEDLSALDFDGGTEPRIGREIMCLAVVSVRETGPTANLMAPIVVNLANRKAVQGVNEGARYPHQHALAPEAVPCSWCRAGRGRRS